MPKILEGGFQQSMNCELPDVQADFRKGRGTRDQIANIHWIVEKARELQKNIYFCFFWLCQSLWLCRSQQTGKFWKRWEYQTPSPASWEICMQVKEQQLKLDMEKQSGSKLGKEYTKAVYYHPAYLTYMQSTSWEMLVWMKHKLESRLLGEISITSDTQMITPSWQKAKRNLKASCESERGEWKGWLET